MASLNKQLPNQHCCRLEWQIFLELMCSHSSVGTAIKESWFDSPYGKVTFLFFTASKLVVGATQTLIQDFSIM
jgi:hypothetical protein